MNIKPEQIPDEVVEAAMRAEQEFYAEKRYTSFSDIGSTDAHHAMKSALAAALPVLLGAPVAWTEKDGEEWIVYDANSDVGQHILHYQKDMHFIRVFPIFSFATQDTPNADQ